MQPPERFAQKRYPEMSGTAVVQLLQLFNQYDIEVFIDDGWGVDALLGAQTRPHNTFYAFLSYGRAGGVP